MTTNNGNNQKLYEVTNRTTGQKLHLISSNAQHACQQVGWLIGECYVVEQKPRRKPRPDHEPLLLVKIPCQTCPYQWAECRKPLPSDCPVRPQTPELMDWLKQVAQAHVCPYVGQDLNPKDYHLGQKWLKMEQAIEELAPKL